MNEGSATTTVPIMELQLDDDRTINMQIRRTASVLSPHTKQDLQELHGWVTTEDAETHRWLSVALRGLGDTVVKSLDDGEPGGRWQISWNSYGEAGGVHTYGLILREAEELSLEVLQIDVIELHPYEYREQLVGETLTIWAKMVGNHTDVTRINRLIRTHATFPVIRRGIDDEPREMRLGVAEWSEYEDRVKYRLVLVDGEIDQGFRAELGEIQDQNDRSAFGYYANLIDRLFDKLAEKELMTPAELEELRDGARSQPGVARHEFWHVADVDLL